MRLPYIILDISWLAFLLWWTISAFNVKKDQARKMPWWVSPWVRIITLPLVIWFIAAHGGTKPGVDLLLSARPGFLASDIVTWIGAILTACGIAFAIWARVHLGRNWSGRPMIKVDHELVTSGPYRYVRHPIYTGMLTAIFGSALVAGAVWFALFVLVAAMFVARVKKEEGFMMQLFPNQYPEYRKRTYALFPFIY